MRRSWYILVLIAVMFAGCGTGRKTVSTTAGAAVSGRYVVVLSVDGFRWDLASRAETPGLDAIKQAGTYAEIYPCFPSNTFPNHYSMATGLHPDHHGIVHNTFYANDLGGVKYSIGDREKVMDERFYGGEPIWNTAERQGLTSNIFMWVGSEAPVNGKYASVWTPYTGSVSYMDRADWVVDALTRPVHEIPNLIMWYFEEPDAIEHRHGPEAPEVTKKVEEIDTAIRYFMKKAGKSPVYDKTNFIFTSDHGMAGISNERRIDVAPYLDESRIRNYVSSRPLFIEPDEDYVDEVYEILSGLPHMQVFRRGEIPEKYHYGTNTDRIMPIVVLPETGWTISYKGREFRSQGGHGYDPYDKDMSMVFYGIGPDFKANHTQEPFQNLNLHLVISYLLGIEPARPNDCDWDAVKDMFVTY